MSTFPRKTKDISKRNRHQMARKKLGENIEETRESRGLSQVKLAEACEVSQVTISNVENGKRTPSLELLIDISRALKVRPGYLLDNIDYSL